MKLLYLLALLFVVVLMSCNDQEGAGQAKRQYQQSKYAPPAKVDTSLKKH